MATLKLTLGKRVKQNGKVPILFTISHKSITSSFPSEFDVYPENWIGDERTRTWVAGVRNAGSINLALSTILANKTFEMTEIPDKDRLSSRELRDLLSGQKKKQNSSLLLTSHLEKYAEAAKTEGTRKIYMRSCKEVKEYDSDITLQDVTPDWLRGFEAHLSKKGNKTNTIAIYLRNIRAVIKRAIDDEIITRDPFRRFKIHDEPTRERPMTPDQLRILWSASLEPWQEEWVALFKLCFYLVGINMVDLASLVGIDKDGYIRYNRRKTGREYTIKVEPEALAIIEKYRGQKHLLACFDRYTDYKQANRHMMHAVKCIGTKLVDNGSLKRHGRRCGPPKRDMDSSPLADVQQYSCRRTWATVAYNDCDISMDVISLCLGHSDGMGLSVTQRYVRPDQSRIDAANRKVIDYLTGL